MTKKELKKELIDQLRRDSRTNLTEYSKEKNIPTKRIHYEYNKIKEKINKFVPILNLEALGFKRTIIIYEDAIQGIRIINKEKDTFINNTQRLDTGLLVEYVFYQEKEQKKFVQNLKKRKIKFSHHPIQEVIKQEGFTL